MKILIVCATEMECAWLREQLKYQANKEVNFLITGVGTVNTAYHLGKHLTHNQYDNIINIGIAGSFDREFELGEVVEVREETFGELGAEDRDKFLDLRELGFINFKHNSIDYYNTIENPYAKISKLRGVKGLTVNAISGNLETIKVRQGRWQKDIETMEGVAFFQASLLSGMPFCSFRAISNYVELRNRLNWKVELGVRNVQEFVLELINNQFIINV